MSLAIITDSTCDLTARQLAQLHVRRVPLYVHFRGETYKDWVEITPAELIRGVQEGADMPTTSQPTPEDFAGAFRAAVADGAERILVVTISAELSGTHQSATLAAKDAPVPVTVFDARHASLGAAYMVQRAAAMRDDDRSVDDIVAALETIRDRNLLGDARQPAEHPAPADPRERRRRAGRPGARRQEGAARDGVATRVLPRSAP
ncbi:MAG: DegV family EDD domain-containing protein [Deinococcus-Thermus bacterium]|jgi:DegV family protein with EDD domain|nr:DegV family EDD domain-containing protein [Deinococcota bacterium]